MASGARSWSINHLGDSGIQSQNISWMRGKPACRIEGMRQDQVLVKFWVPNVVQEASIAPLDFSVCV